MNTDAIADEIFALLAERGATIEEAHEILRLTRIKTWHSPVGRGDDLPEKPLHTEIVELLAQRGVSVDDAYTVLNCAMQEISAYRRGYYKARPITVADILTAEPERLGKKG